MWVPKVRYFESTKFIWNAAWRWKQFICPSMWAKTLVCPYSGLPLFSIFESPIIHSVCPSPHSPPKWEDCIFHFLRACENNNLGRIWGTNRVYYGLFGNSQWFLCWQRSRSRREKNEKNYHCKFPWLAGWWCGAGLTNSPPPLPPTWKKEGIALWESKGKNAWGKHVIERTKAGESCGKQPKRWHETESFGQTAWRACAPTSATKLLMMMMKYATTLN